MYVGAARPRNVRSCRARIRYRLLPLFALDFLLCLEIGAGCGEGAITSG
jgi:hypothetical protein